MPWLLAAWHYIAIMYRLRLQTRAFTVEGRPANGQGSWVNLPLCPWAHHHRVWISSYRVTGCQGMSRVPDIFLRVWRHPPTLMLTESKSHPIQTSNQIIKSSNASNHQINACKHRYMLKTSNPWFDHLSKEWLICDTCLSDDIIYSYIFIYLTYPHICQFFVHAKWAVTEVARSEES